MSAKPAAKSKASPAKLVDAPRIQRARTRASIPARASDGPPVEAPPAASPPPAAIVASAIEMVAFRDLKRAPENARHIRKDEDVEPLAEDIAAHGLLQSLIGYRAIDEQHRMPREKVWIVAGGRRLQALGSLLDRGDIGIDFAVPVLIRDRDEAIELSLSENLQKRDMSPVDEACAFTALMDLGTHSPEELGRRFGFTERYVRQRLRLAQLADPILDALAERRIGLASAMEYAASSDAELQLQVFRQQEKTSFDAHDPRRIRADYSAAQMTTASPVFRFVGAATYEADGGTYEDDLFAADLSATGGRKIAGGPILAAAARRMLEFQAIRIETELREKHPSIVGSVVAPNLQIGTYPWTAPKPPAGFTLVETDYYGNDAATIWRRIDKGAVPVHLIVGVTHAGEIATSRDKFLVPRGQVETVKPKPKSGSSTQQETPEQRAVRQRDSAVEIEAWRLAVGRFEGTFLEGRAHWPTSGYIGGIDRSYDDRFESGRLVAIQVFVTDEQQEAQRVEAERRVDERLAAEAAREAEKAAARKRRDDLAAELVALDPPPAVIAVGGHPYFRKPDGEWCEDAAQVDDPDKLGTFPGIASLLEHFDLDEPIEHFASIEAYRAVAASDREMA